MLMIFTFNLSGSVADVAFVKYDGTEYDSWRSWRTAPELRSIELN